MSHKRVQLLAATAALVIVVASCSSSSKPAASATGSAAGTTYTVGLLTDLTGGGAAPAKDSVKGVEAGIGLAAREGYRIKYVVADTGTTTAGALVAAQKLVDQDHVFAVLAISAVTFAAASFLASKGIPVVGVSYDGPEWNKTQSMFSIYGYDDYSKVETTTGQFLKMEGGTVVGSLGFATSPSSSESAKATAISAQTAGLSVGYLNPELPYATTDVGPIALAMKAGRVDALAPEIGEETSFVLIRTLKQEGVNLKVALLATGGGGDLLSSGPATLQAAQGVDFASPFEPVTMHTAATNTLQNALKTYAGVTSEPTAGEYNGYLSVDGLVTGLKAAGPHPTKESFINAMLGITNYNAAGLYRTHSIGFAMNQRGQAAGADNCTWVTQYSGSSFHLIPGADPICGSVIPGKTVSGSS
jgi:branched-chain amino acid transport system substrate-binding protein